MNDWVQAERKDRWDGEGTEGEDRSLNSSSRLSTGRLSQRLIAGNGNLLRPT